MSKKNTKQLRRIADALEAVADELNRIRAAYNDEEVCDIPGCRDFGGCRHNSRPGVGICQRHFDMIIELDRLGGLMDACADPASDKFDHWLKRAQQIEVELGL